MKHHFVIGIVLFIMANGVPSSAQKSPGEQESYLTDLYQSRDYLTFFKKINQFRDTAFAGKDTATLTLLSNFLKRDFDSLNTREKLQLRITSTYMGNDIRELTGNNNRALGLYLIAHENVNNKIFLDSLSWFIENKIANIYTAKDNYEKAEYFSDLLERSLKHYNQFNNLSRFYTNKGRKLKSENKISEAIKIFKQGIALADSIGFRKGVFANAINLAGIYNEILDQQNAEIYLHKADSLLVYVNDGKDSLENKSNLFLEKANLHVIKGNYESSIPLYKKSIDLLGFHFINSYRREFAKYYKSLASAFFLMDSLNASDEAVNKGLKSLIPEFNILSDFPEESKIYAENSFFELLGIKAKIYEKKYTKEGRLEDLEKSLQSIRLALYANDLIRDNLIADPSKLLSIRNNKQLVENAIANLYILMRVDPGPDHIASARYFFNKSKSILYDEKSNQTQLIQLLSTEEKEQVRDLQRKLQELYDSKYESGSDIIAINGEILSVSEKINAILTPYKTKLANVSRPQNYIEYAVTDSHIHVLSELNHEIRLMQLLTPEYLKPLLSRMDEYIRLKNFSKDEKILNELYHALILPVAEKLPPKVVIIPDGALGFIPFEMLKDDSDSFLIQHTTISYNFEYETQELPVIDQDRKWDIICLAPEYPLKETAGKDQTRGNIYHLPYAKIEVDSLSRLFGSKALVMQSTDVEKWDDLMEQARIFHYAGHAIIKSDHAYLALTEKENEKDQLQAEEIKRMHFPLDMVVLSACETGLGKIAEGEGIQSLGRSFMESGAKSTIISLWNVNDKSTSKIISAFYTYLKQGRSKDESLRLAKLDYINSAPPNLKHPFFWAPFIPAGNMAALGS